MYRHHKIYSVGFFFKDKVGERMEGGFRRRSLGGRQGGVRDEFDQNIFYTCVTFSVNKNIVLKEGGNRKDFCTI